MTANNNRSNYSIFVPAESASPKDGLMAHIAGLGRLARLDFERCAVAGEIIYAVEGDAAPVAQADEEARIGTLAYALKKLGNAVDAAEFMRCLNALCEEGDARYRQVVASYYYGEIAARGCREVLKEMALLAMQLASLHPVLDEVEESEWANASNEYGDDDENEASLFAQEVAAMMRLVSVRRRAATLCCSISDWRKTARRRRDRARVCRLRRPLMGRPNS